METCSDLKVDVNGEETSMVDKVVSVMVCFSFIVQFTKFFILLPSLAFPAAAS